MIGLWDVDNNGQGSFAHELNGSFQEVYPGSLRQSSQKLSVILELRITLNYVIVIRKKHGTSYHWLT